MTVIVCLLVAGLGALGYYLYNQANSGLFFEETKLNGYDVAGQTCKQVLETMERDFSAPKLELSEGGESALTLTLAEMGYTIDRMELLERIQGCMRRQNLRLLFSLLGGNEFEIEIPFEFDEKVFNTAVSASRFAKPRTASVDASLEYDGVEYYIQPEVYGNEMDDADLRVLVRDFADKLTSQTRPQADASLAVPDSFYFLPAVTQDDRALNDQMQAYNTFCKARVTLTFGDTKEVVDWNTVKGWLDIDGAQATLREEDVYNYVYALADRYDTLYYERDFVAHDGHTVSYESSDYGYQIDRDAEAAQMIADIQSNTAVEREPVYAVKGYRRNGRDDICGNYVEVNLSQQHLWFYMDGELIIETDVVSGLPRDDRGTVTGVFTIPYKKSPETLKGDTWEEEVTYWMPFHDGQGLHDAPWRNAFGGSIYQTNGSHGWVNLPYDAAQVIYEHMQERFPIFLYY